MPSPKQFKLPDVGEGLTEAEILTWHVQPGDAVTVNQTVVEIETAKSAVELPSPYAGVVTELLAEEGATVAVGVPIITIDTEPVAAGEAPETAGTPGSEHPPAPPGGGRGLREDMVPAIPVPADDAPTADATADAPVEPGLIGGPAPGGRTSVLVGYGPRTVEAKRRPRKDQAGATPSVPATPDSPPAQYGQTPALSTPEPSTARVEPPGGLAAPPGNGGAAVLAKPPVRKLARDLGIDLATVRATGTAGTITRGDVERAAAGAVAPPTSPSASISVSTSPGTASGREERIPVKGVRKMTAQAMVASAFTAPHVTEWVSVDVTRSMRLVRRLRQRPEYAEVRVGPLLLVAKALLLGVRRHPGVNASWDEAAQEIVVKHDVNLGLAAATPRGLLVPNIKGAQDLALPDLARAMGALVALARSGKTPPGDMAGGTITITNVGVFGVDGGTPILNPGEAAILAFGQVRRLPWVHRGKVQPRQVTQLALSFDHRIVDGELGSLFLAHIAAVLEDPAVGLSLA